MRAKKSLGQHFLSSKHIVSAIVSTADVSASDTVLEVGPGKGVLTEAILEKAARVIAVEKDDRLISFLEEKFSREIANGKLILVHDDILRFNLSSYQLQTTGYKLIANIPYYITGQLFKLFLESSVQPSLMVLLIQKEVAVRIAAKDKKESLLSISVKIYGVPRYVKSVPAHYFSPKPRVDSAILSVEHIASPFRSDAEQKKFFAIARKGFAHKRKLLRSNLGCETKVFKTCGIPEKARAENCTIENWLCLSKHL
ncbi:MAG: 16S rRNA (adenine(1518)-N(6)/adenine(1519)-N(6))-dimethyltransferase RsmA [Candidatus Yonathbacteria bacterium]|nr:16S rRNA (adenine(1518)-N(6)/adenine(1519)-N(6))-dimethyltransferase RsmA [Candidatus Yonathbacteria bacterium]